MRKIAVATICLSIAVIVADIASAQQPRRQPGGRGFGGFGFRGGSSAMLLANEGVQKELKMTEEQVEKVTGEIRSTFTGLQDIPREERREKMQELTAKLDKSIKGILNEEQNKRLEQISIQQAGIFAATRDNDLGKKISTALKLTDEQKEQLQGIQQKMGEDVRELFQSGGQGGFNREMMEKVTALREEANEKGMGVLKEEQKAAWKDLTGKPFEVQFQRRGRPRDDD